ncbi:MAG: polysaccharide biosynthesis/export family protein [Gemmatimonadota bacterium]
MAIASFAALPGGLSGQAAASWDPSGLQAGRTELLDLLERTEAVASSTVYSGRERDAARRDAALIQQRLSEGDFQIGDQVTLTVFGEPALQAVTVPVEGGPRITLPQLGPISLRGVLRSEVIPHLTQELGRFITNPQVQASSQIRLSILGAVGAPGFYTAPSDMLLSEFIQLAGGPGSNANLEDISIERMGQEFWTGDELRVVLAQGRTLDQMNLRGGDQVVIPEQTGSVWGSVLRWGVAVATSVAFGFSLF